MFGDISDDHDSGRGITIAKQWVSSAADHLNNVHNSHSQPKMSPKCQYCVAKETLPRYRFQDFSGVRSKDFQNYSEHTCFGHLAVIIINEKLTTLIIHDV